MDSGNEEIEGRANCASSFAESAFNPVVDLCTQIADPVDISFDPVFDICTQIEPIDCDIPSLVNFNPPEPTRLPLRTEPKHVAARIRSRRHRDKEKVKKIKEKEEFSALISNFIAPNHGCGKGNVPFCRHFFHPLGNTPQRFESEWSVY